MQTKALVYFVNYNLLILKAEYFTSSFNQQMNISIIGYGWDDQVGSTKFYDLGNPPTFLMYSQQWEMPIEILVLSRCFSFSLEFFKSSFISLSLVIGTTFIQTTEVLHCATYFVMHCWNTRPVEKTTYSNCDSTGINLLNKITISLSSLARAQM